MRIKSSVKLFFLLRFFGDVERIGKKSFKITKYYFNKNNNKKVNIMAIKVNIMAMIPRKSFSCPKDRPKMAHATRHTHSSPIRSR